MTQKILKNSFISGELSNKLQNKFDFANYQTGAKWIENFIITKEGIAQYRNGSYFFADTEIVDSTATKNVRLIPWVRSEDTIFLLVFYNNSLKIFQNFTLIATLTTPYSLTDINNIQIDTYGNIMYIVDGNHNMYQLNWASGTSFTLSSVLYSNTPPWEEVNLTATTMRASAATGNITITSSANVFTDYDLYKYIKITNIGAGTSGYARITAINSATQVNATVITALTTTSATSSWNFSIAQNTVCFFQSRLWIANDNKIFASRTQTNDGIPRFNDFTTGSNNDHAISLVNTMFKTSILWLRGVNNVLFAGTPTTIFKLFSDSGYFTPTNLPVISPISNDGSKRIIPLQEKNTIFYVASVGLQGDKGSRMNTIRYSWETSDYVINNTNLLSEDVNKEGVIDTAFLKSYDDILYCLKSNGEISYLNYNPEQQVSCWGRITTADYNRRKSSLSTDGFIEAITSLRQTDGSDLLVLCVRRNINGTVKRYLEYILNTQNNTIDTSYYTGNQSEDKDNYNYDFLNNQLNFNNLDCASIYNGTKSNDLTLTSLSLGEAIATSTTYTFVSGDVGREIREIADLNNSNGCATIYEYVDANTVKINITIPFSSLSLTSFILTTNEITSLGYLEGKEVNTWIDGSLGQSYTVSSGSITLQSQISFLIVGLKYNGILQTMNLNFSSQNGDTSVFRKSINKIYVYFYNTVGCKLGTSLYNNTYNFITPSLRIGQAPMLFSGIKEFIINDTPNFDKTVYILKDDNSPCSIQYLNIIINFAEA